jgi:hypothetical protein
MSRFGLGNRLGTRRAGLRRRQSTYDRARPLTSRRTNAHPRPPTAPAWRRVLAAKRMGTPSKSCIAMATIDRGLTETPTSRCSTSRGRHPPSCFNSPSSGRRCRHGVGGLPPPPSSRARRDRHPENHWVRSQHAFTSVWFCRCSNRADDHDRGAAAVEQCCDFDSLIALVRAVGNGVELRGRRSRAGRRSCSCLSAPQCGLVVTSLGHPLGRSPLDPMRPVMHRRTAV